MRRISLFIFLVLNVFVVRSQIISDSVRAFNCYHDGAIFLDVLPVFQVDSWYFNDELLGWIEADTMVEYLSVNSDTLITQDCGSYKVLIGGDTSFFYISCPLGSLGSHLNVECFGDSTGMLKRVAHSGSPPYFYEWFKDGLFYSSGDNDTVFNNLAVGSYKIIFTDSIGCFDSVLTNVSSPQLLVLDTIFTSNINCIGVNSGNVVFSVSGGKKYTVGEQYNYYLINLISSDTVSFITRDSISVNVSSTNFPYQINSDSLLAGEYIISIVDSFGCTLSDTFALIEPDPYQVFGSTIFPLICESDSGYFMIDSVIGGGNINFGFNYNVGQGPYGDSLYVPAGWYQIFIEDLDFGCIDTALVRCYAQYEIDVFTTITPVSCFGDESGSVIIDSIIGGNIPYDVQWGGVDNEALGAGIYFVNIVDSIGCVHQEEYEIIQPNQIDPNAEIYISTCYSTTNGSILIDVTGGTGQLNYNWLNGTGTPDSLYGLTDGIYTLVVIDEASCVDTFSFYLQSPQLLELDLAALDSNLACSGGVTLIDVIIYGGTPPYLINWNDGDTNQQRVVGAGYYQVEIIDANGCSAIQSIIITEPPPLEIAIEYIDITCDQGGTATVSATGGVPPISYLWNTGDTTFTIDSLWELTYWVVATDSCGASVSDTIYLHYYDLNTVVDYDTLTHIAEVNIESTTSSGPFEHIWLDILGDSIGTGAISPVLCEGIYFVVTIDLATNCTVTDTLLVEFYLPSGILDVTTTTVYSDSNLWGFAPYTYLWSNGEVSQHADICPGYHWVEVTDINNCLIRQDFIIEDLIITLDPASAIIECSIENIDIELEASTTGGIEPYSFQWWNGSTENPINLGIDPGNYSVSVVDGNGCFEDTSFVIATMTSQCIPNVFTPNGDGINDNWSLEDTFLYEDSEVRIYGRFGRLLFESVGYHDKWNGTNKKGFDVPAGVYFYSIDIGHGFDQINGTVTILR